MVKDYFQDIVPPSSDEPNHIVRQPAAPNQTKAVPPDHTEFADMDSDTLSEDTPPAPPARGIRNINITPTRAASRLSTSDMRDPSSEQRYVPSRLHGRFSGKLIWILAAVCILVLAVLGLFAFRQTTVTVVPQSHVIVFDQTSNFTAYPSSSAASGTLPYTLVIADFDDSQVVPVQGTSTMQVSSKASGSITVYNSYSATSVRLVKNTRFQTPGGLIFRAPADIIVPGKNKNTSGSVKVTVVADQPGATYNVGPTSRFTVPGLKSDAAMYAGVYAQSTTAMSGGASGNGPAMAPGAQDAAIAAIRDRLQQKAIQALDTNNPSVTIFPSLMRLTYQDMPSTTEANGDIRIHESVHAITPAFPSDLFAHTVAAPILVDGDTSSLSLIPGAGYAANLTSSASSTLGVDPITVALSGTATVVWNVDTVALAKDLAGRDDNAFQTIVKSFPGVQEAHARIEPFWKSSFPSDPSKIKIELLPTQSAK